MSGSAGSGQWGFYAGLYWVWGVTRGRWEPAFLAVGGVTRGSATRPLRGAISGVSVGLVHHVEMKVDSSMDG